MTSKRRLRGGNVLAIDLRERSIRPRSVPRAGDRCGKAAMLVAAYALQHRRPTVHVAINPVDTHACYNTGTPSSVATHLFKKETALLFRRPGPIETFSVFLMHVAGKTVRARMPVEAGAAFFSHVRLMVLVRVSSSRRFEEVF